MMNMERDYRLDVLRVIAISLIVLMHSPIPNSAPGFVLTGISYLTAPGIGLFFMISGALLLGNKLSTGEFLKRRFSKVLFPTLFWTAFYLVVKCIKAPIPMADLVRIVLSIPFSAQGHGVLWFMYTLAGLYLLTPILSRWLKTATKREIEFYLMLWGVTLLYPYLKPVLTINESDTGLLYYFAGYSGYFLFGYYLKYLYEFKWTHVFLALAIAIMVPAVLYSSQVEFDFYSMLWYLSLPVACMAFIWYALICQLHNKRITMFSDLSRLSFGIYLIHIFIMRDLLWQVDAISLLPGLIQIAVITIVTLLFSYIVVWSISKLSFSKYIIGV